MTLTPCPVLIDGEWTKLSDLPTTPVNNPSTGELIAEAPLCSAHHVDQAVAAANLACALQGQRKPGASGWAIHGLSSGQPENHCASLFGYGPLAALVGLFERHGVDVDVPQGMPAGPCYAMFTWGCVGIIDRQSLVNITGEAWVRNPTTIVKTLG